ncbi:Uncharacterised protein [Mycobacteroides abscessus subsp. abscessus]|nr:Uncharacterised protein [Mycobacteroides abscessus subsp. abscessus]SLD08596.1 Uncharacterised protein [Mycobacteroides abscessus subsp. massiliense]
MEERILDLARQEFQHRAIEAHLEERDDGGHVDEREPPVTEVVESTKCLQ